MRDSAAVEHDEKEIKQVLRHFTRCFSTYDAEGFVKIWDDQADFIVYQPEELPHAFFSIAELREYANNLKNVVKGMGDVKVIDFKIVVDGDFATVFVRFWARLSFMKVPQVVDGQIRQSFVLRRREDGWKLTHYHESRQAAGFEQAVGTW